MGTGEWEVKRTKLGVDAVGRVKGTKLSSPRVKRTKLNYNRGGSKNRSSEKD
jgi:hypothetical protein